MRKNEKPTFHSDDGTIFDTAEKAAKQDATNIFGSMFESELECGEGIPLRSLADKWVGIRNRLNVLHEEFMASKKSAPEVVQDIEAFPPVISRRHVNRDRPRGWHPDDDQIA